LSSPFTLSLQQSAFPKSKTFSHGEIESVNSRTTTAVKPPDPRRKVQAPALRNCDDAQSIVTTPTPPSALGDQAGLLADPTEAPLRVDTDTNLGGWSLTRARSIEGSKPAGSDHRRSEAQTAQACGLSSGKLIFSTNLIDTYATVPIDVRIPCSLA